MILNGSVKVLSVFSLDELGRLLSLLSSSGDFSMHDIGSRDCPPYGSHPQALT